MTDLRAVSIGRALEAVQEAEEALETAEGLPPLVEAGIKGHVALIYRLAAQAAASAPRTDAILREITGAALRLRTLTALADPGLILALADHGCISTETPVRAHPYYTTC